MRFKDHFSRHSSAYHRYRPQYPEDLFTYLASLTQRHDVAWDCAAGSGQAALGIAGHFRMVIATDASSAQMHHRLTHPAVRHAVMTAEQPGLAKDSVDLVTVAQALHWLDLGTFYPEVKRVLRPGGVFAAWCYRLLSVSTELNAVISELYRGLLGPYWPAERRLVDEGYARLPFPFMPLPAYQSQMNVEWTFKELVGYLRTWSAVQRFRQARGDDPVSTVSHELQHAWGASTRRQVRWPITLRVGRVD